MCVCVRIPSGMLTESSSGKEGPEVSGSEPGSPGDGSKEEELDSDGSVFR